MKNKEIFQKSKKLVDSLKDQGPTQDHMEELADGYPKIYKHSIRVSILSVTLGFLNDLNRSDLRSLGLAGLLHDIGKLDVDPDILKKNDKLDKKEREEIRKHPRFSFERLEDDFFKEVRKIVVAHHEYQDSPYPREDDRDIDPGVDFLAQILAVSDMYDALSSDRPYKESLEKQDIEKIMKNEFVGEEKLINQILNLNI